MKDLVELGNLIEVNTLQNIAYILNENSMFFQAEYKVLQAQEKDGFIKCAKLKYNGKIKLLYMTSEYKSFSELLPSLDTDSFVTIVSNLLSSIIKVKNNGFLKCSNINISLDKIFINTDTLAIGLIYLPIYVLSNDITEFETELRTNIIKAIDSCNALNLDNISQIYEDLENRATTLEQVHIMVSNECNGTNSTYGKTEQPREKKKWFKEKIKKEDKNIQPQLLLSSLGNSEKAEFYISKPEFVIGKNASAVDGVITFNNAVSRVHCKIVYNNKKYYIVDLGSANGTFFNSTRLIANKPVVIKNGDILKLANSEFIISI